MHTKFDIYDPSGYVEAPPHEVFEHLRQTQPVFWQDMPNEPGYWAVLKHADVKFVSLRTRLFSSREGGVILQNWPPDQLEIIRKMLISMDPPRHLRFRVPLVQSFAHNTLVKLGGHIREITRHILSDAAARCKVEGQVEFAQVASRMPVQVFGELAGLPPEDWDHLHGLAEQLIRCQDPEFNATGDMQTINAQVIDYATRFAAKRRKTPPQNDLTDVMLGSDFDGAPMTDEDFAGFFLQIFVAGNDTTVSALSAGLLALLQHPEQMAEVRANPSLIPGAVEEIFRWTTPVHYMRRTAVVDIDIRDVRIKAGDKVALVYASANRDEDVFTDPHRFDIHRSPNPHLAFGIGEHVCLGIHLSRLEAKIFFEELFSMFPTIELTDSPKRFRSNLINGLKQLPVALCTD